MTAIRAIPKRYHGVQFRSTLEADWAAFLDLLGISWQYEPEAFKLPSDACYRPDFYLPGCKTWLEVKGPHNERIEKTREFNRALFDESADMGQWPLVVVGRPACRGSAAYERVDNEDEIAIICCQRCGNYSFFDYLGIWECRVCNERGKAHYIADVYPSGSIAWTTAA